ncbi:MAG TPA: DoxX family protein [Rhizomicrobium sp.]|nr:DoxX family protein [Rhizomicrobium sp.]
MSNMTRYLPFLGRLLIGGIFALSGFAKLSAYGPTTAEIAHAGLPFPPLAFAVAVIVELGFGLLLVIGFRARLVALVLAIWCVVTAVFFHTNFADQMQMINFVKNLMIAGGLLQIVHFGAGAISVDARRT